MDKAEFDKFAEEYRATHAAHITASGEAPEYFAEYKIRDLAHEIRRARLDAARMLDFGAGVGNSVRHVAALLPGIALTCADVSRQSLEIARARHAGMAVDYVELDGTRLPFDDSSFDIVFSACVFHHIPPSEHGLWLRELRRVTGPGGMAMIYEHNPLNPLTSSIVDECPFDSDAVLIRAGRLHRRMSDAGWSNVRTEFRVFFPRALAFARPVERWLAWLPLGAQYYAVGRA